MKIVKFRGTEENAKEYWINFEKELKKYYNINKNGSDRMLQPDINDQES